MNLEVLDISYSGVQELMEDFGKIHYIIGFDAWVVPPCQGYRNHLVMLR